MNGHSGVVRLLLKAGADTGVADADGATAWAHGSAERTLGSCAIVDVLCHT